MEKANGIEAMTPTWTSDCGTVKLWLADCLDVLPTLSGVDAVVTDPPYGVLSEDWDDMNERELARFTMAWVSMAALHSQTLLAFFGEKTRHIAVPLLQLLFPKVRQFIWNKSGGQIAEDRAFYSFESAWLCKSRDTWEVCEPKALEVGALIRSAREAKGLSRGGVDMALRGKKTGLCYRWEEAACLPTPDQAEKLKVLLNLNEKLTEALAVAYAARNEVLEKAAAQTKSMAAGACDVLTYSPPTDKVHPCEKPAELLAALVAIASDESATILDPFMGSGTTGVACVRTNRRFLGIEKEEKYFEIAKRRIQDELTRKNSTYHKQPEKYPLFSGKEPSP
jgi:hypothetical protein